MLSYLVSLPSSAKKTVSRIVNWGFVGWRVVKNTVAGLLFLVYVRRSPDKAFVPHLIMQFSSAHKQPSHKSWVGKDESGINHPSSIVLFFSFSFLVSLWIAHTKSPTFFHKWLVWSSHTLDGGRPDPDRQWYAYYADVHNTRKYIIELIMYVHLTQEKLETLHCIHCEFPCCRE